MSEKKDPGATGSNIETQRKERYSRRIRPSIVITTRGAETIAPSARLPPDKPGKRGTVKGWSARSRMRLRRFMLMHEPSRNVWEANVTLTIPGPEVSIEEMRELWRRFCREIDRRGWSAIWRLEIQARGQPHWHLCMSVPVDKSPTIGEAFFDLTGLWSRCVQSLGPCIHECKAGGIQSVYEFQHRMDIPGADRYACHVQFEAQADPAARSAWRRYMQDHTGKAKQQQIAEGFGRHWGVVGRKGYRAASPQLESMDDYQFFRVLRWLQRMSAGTVRESRAPFGRKRAKRKHRGTLGKSVWFSNPATIQRMISLSRTGSCPPSAPL